MKFMKIKVISVNNHGDHTKEYVLFKVQEDCDTGRFVLADSTYNSDGTISNKVRHTYWFPNHKVKKGDLISVWTKSGTTTTTKTDSGTPIHRFYWSLNTSVWNDDGDCAVLLQIDTWQLFKVND
jgi:hypothetical protein